MSAASNRELRALGDVTVVDANPDWTLHVIALEMKTGLWVLQGYSISFVVTSTFNLMRLYEMMRLKAEHLPPPAIRHHIEMFIKGVEKDFMYNLERYRPDSFYLIHGSPDQLMGLCQQVIAQFDINHLEPGRKWKLESERWRTIIAAQDLLKKAGFDPGSQNGVLNDETRKALRAYQQQQGLHVTGELDDATRKALGLP